MASSKQILVTGKEGLHGVIVPEAQGGSKDQKRVLVQLESGEQVFVPTDVLVEMKDGSYYLPLSLADLKRQGETKVTSNDEAIVLPVIEEQIQVNKRTIASGGTRIRKLVHEHEEVVDEPLLREEVKVERVAINQVVATAPQIRYEGETMIIPLLEEVLVVEKRLIVKEELRVTRHQATYSQPQTVTLRSEEVVLEPIAPDAQVSQSNT